MTVSAQNFIRPLVNKVVRPGSLAVGRWRIEMASEITLLDEMFKVDEVDSSRYDRGTPFYHSSS